MARPIAKIIKKGSPTEHKRGPGLKGLDRLRQRVTKLALDAHRLARKPGPLANRAAILATDLIALKNRLDSMEADEVESNPSTS